MAVIRSERWLRYLWHIGYHKTTCTKPFSSCESWGLFCLHIPCFVISCSQNTHKEKECFSLLLKRSIRERKKEANRNVNDDILVKENENYTTAVFNQKPEISFHSLNSFGFHFKNSWLKTTV